MNQPHDSNNQTQTRGTLQDEYAIYVANVTALGFPVKSFDEWLDS